MAKPRRTLSVVSAKETKLGRPTIMDRALAHRYGAPYVHLAAFAIDVDRVHALEDESLPFGWEVYLTEVQLARFISSSNHDPVPLLEDTCLAIMELPRPKAGQLAAFGSQLVFAVYTAVARGIVPPQLGHCFASWKKPPADLIDEMAELANQEGLAQRLARHCLEAPIEPPLVAPVREALLAI
jgi:hypothetical protein